MDVEGSGLGINVRHISALLAGTELARKVVLVHVMKAYEGADYSCARS